MITAISLAAAAVASSALGFPAAAGSASAGIQASPVCIPSDVTPGRSYRETLYVTGTGTFTVAVVPVTTGPATHLRQVPASWVTSGSAAPGSGGADIPFTLHVPSGAAPGPYWSWAATSSGTAASGPGVTATLAAGAMTWLMFTVGPSAVPPPPCDALDLAESTGKFPGWPAPAFATASWKQELDLEDPAGSGPKGFVNVFPSAGATPAAAPVATFTPVAATGPSIPKKLPSDWDGWAFVIGIIVIGVFAVRRKFRS